MSRTIPTTEPSVGDGLEWRAGDSWEFDIADHSDYPIADGWTLTYSLRRVSGSPDATGSLTFDITSSHVTQDGTTNEVRVPATDTARLRSGVWEWYAHYTLSPDRFTVRSGRFEVLADMATLEATESSDEVELRLVRTAIQDLLTAGVSSYQLNGRAVNKLDLPALRAQQAILESRIDTQGSGTPFRALAQVAFVTPR